MSALDEDALLKKEQDLNKEQQESEEDDGYEEDEDEDYDPTKSKANEDNSDAEGDSDNEFQDAKVVSKEIKKANYSSIDNGEGGFIRTRRQREDEAKEEKKFKLRKSSSNNKSKLDIDSIWDELNSKPSPVTGKPVATAEDVKVEGFKDTPAQQKSTNNKTTANTNNNSIEPEQVKIKRTYEFAGETITEEKWVDANSQEAKAHFNSTKIKENTTSSSKSSGTATSTSSLSKSNFPGKRPPKRKRPGLLEAVINGTSNAKLSTLEKSRLDWATYVDKQKIGDELKTANKGGYLEKQDFLARVESKKDERYKDAKAHIVSSNNNNNPNK